jgi:hypothetical protein
MLELTLLALHNGLTTWGTGPVIATRIVAADAPALQALLCDPAGQPGLAAAMSPRLWLDLEARPPTGTRYVHARLRLGARDVLFLTWLLTPGRGTTELDLAAQPASRGLLARVAMLGGRRLLLRRLQATLDEVAAVARHAAEGLGAPTAPGVDVAPAQVAAHPA